VVDRRFRGRILPWHNPSPTVVAAHAAHGREDYPPKPQRQEDSDKKPDFLYGSTSRLTIRSLDGISLRVWKRPDTEPAQPIPDQPEEAAVEAAKCPFH
jgi:hypothetical protein